MSWLWRLIPNGAADLDEEHDAPEWLLHLNDEEPPPPQPSVLEQLRKDFFDEDEMKQKQAHLKKLQGNPNTKPEELQKAKNELKPYELGKQIKSCGRTFVTDAVQQFAKQLQTKEMTLDHVGEILCTAALDAAFSVGPWASTLSSLKGLFDPKPSMAEQIVKALLPQFNRIATQINQGRLDSVRTAYHEMNSWLELNQKNPGNFDKFLEKTVSFTASLRTAATTIPFDLMPLATELIRLGISSTLVLYHTEEANPSQSKQQWDVIRKSLLRTLATLALAFEQLWAESLKLFRERQLLPRPAKPGLMEVHKNAEVLATRLGTTVGGCPLITAHLQATLERGVMEMEKRQQMGKEPELDWNLGSEGVTDTLSQIGLMMNPGAPFPTFTKNDLADIYSTRAMDWRARVHELGVQEDRRQIRLQLQPLCTTLQRLRAAPIILHHRASDATPTPAPAPAPPPAPYPPAPAKPVPLPYPPAVQKLVTSLISAQSLPGKMIPGIITAAGREALAADSTLIPKLQPCGWRGEAGGELKEVYQGTLEDMLGAVMHHYGRLWAVKGQWRHKENGWRIWMGQYDCVQFFWIAHRSALTFSNQAPPAEQSRRHACWTKSAFADALVHEHKPLALAIRH